MPYKKIKSVFILFLIISLINLPRINLEGKNLENITFDIEPEANKKWTLMLYFCADTRVTKVTSSLDNSVNYLSDCMLEAITGIVDNNLLPGSEVDINVIALYDYPYTVTDPYGHAYVYELKAASAGGSTTISDLGQTNMGDEQTLDDFIAFCKTNYPADHYALSLIDHGRAYAGFCYDYHALHPYMEYALGDCLTLPELEDALSGTNNIDVLLMNTCLGGSLELVWQLQDEVSYIIAGETTFGSNQLYSPQEYAYNLSRNPNLTPREFAQMAFNIAKTPVALPAWRDWGTCSLYDVTKMSAATLGPSFIELFNLFVESLHDELDYNPAIRTIFLRLRQQDMGTAGMAPSTAMLVDLYDCIEVIVGNSSQYHYSTIETYGNQLLAMLEPNPNGILVDHYNVWTEEHEDPAPFLQGFNICFPDSKDMFKGFLYPNMYADLNMSKMTRWDDFINRLFPTLAFDKFKLKDFYEIQLFLIDPSIKLDVFYEVTPEEVYHVGLNDAFPNSHMGTEIGIQGAEYQDDLYGNFMIRIPASSLVQTKDASDVSFMVVVNATCAASASQDVNLTVKHVIEDEIFWQESQTSDIKIGQTLTTIITTDDTMSEFEVDEIETKTKNFGLEESSGFVIYLFTSIVFAVCVIQKRKKKN
ncbi:MAG: hypothetical protein EAX90_10775 [Candidatus Heimdallarchaeota archaeon]|nr:hypothetical protein [Candidatus Heimdallarchaeota archaeon]